MLRRDVRRNQRIVEVLGLRSRHLHEHNWELELHGVFGGQIRVDASLDGLRCVPGWAVSGCFGTKFMPELLSGLLHKYSGQLVMYCLQGGPDLGDARCHEVHSLLQRSVSASTRAE